MSTEADKRLKLNLALFERMLPSLHARLAGILDGAEATDVPLPQPYKKLRIQLGAPEREEIDVQTFDFIDRMLTRCRDTGIVLFETSRTQDSYYMLLVGAPDDAVLEAALDLHKPMCLLVGVGDPVRFATSLRTVDWIRHMSGVQERGGAVYLLPEETPDAIVEAAWRACRTHNPTRIDGFTALVTGEPAMQAQTFDLLKQTLMLSTSLLGFFHDETVMQWNTYRNMRSGKARTFRRRVANDDGFGALGVPAFVVASGPSLDADLPEIRARAQDAVVISLASSLRPLLTAGIKPDFHVELENVHITPKLIELSRHHDLSGIKLVAAASVEPAVLDYVDTAILYARFALSSYPVFAKGIEETLRLPGPTAGNAALCFALESGFDEVYLFGLDLGTTDPGRHHAQSSYYYTDGAVPHVDAYDLPIPGNFQETVHTSRPFLSALKNANDLVRMFRNDARVFNCSGGARIGSAVPKHAADIEIASRPGSKDAALEALNAGFAPVAPEAVIWPGPAFADALRAVAGRFRDAMAQPDALANGGFERDLLASAHMRAGYQDPPPPGRDMAAAMMLRGTLLAMTLFLNRYRRRVARPEDETRFAQIAAEEFIRALDAIEAQALDLLSGDTPRQPPPVDKRIAAPGRRFPAPLTLARNASCPCGSGRRYKQCHGVAA